MKCGNCSHWEWKLQGATLEDLLKQFNTFGKALGACTKDHHYYPMMNYEDCGFCKNQKEEKTMTAGAADYTAKLLNAMGVNFSNGCELYYGKTGALRLARGYGYGLNDFPHQEAIDAMKGSYSSLFVRLYVFGAFANSIKGEFLDAKEWCQEIMNQMACYQWEELKRGKELILSENGINQIKKHAYETGESIIFDNCFSKRFSNSYEIDYICKVEVKDGNTNVFISPKQLRTIEDTEFTELREAAKGMGLPYVGVDKETLKRNVDNYLAALSSSNPVGEAIDFIGEKPNLPDESFYTLYCAGELELKDIDEYIEVWHHSGEDCPYELHEFLGLTWDQYKHWVETGELEVYKA